MTPRECLLDIFAGYLNQDTIEEAVAGMVFVSADDPCWHQQFMEALDDGIASCRRRDASIIDVINQSGYRANTVEEAERLIREVREHYIRAYQAATESR
jgi:hypothetical protein